MGGPDALYFGYPEVEDQVIGESLSPGQGVEFVLEKEEVEYEVEAVE